MQAGRVMSIFSILRQLILFSRSESVTSSFASVNGQNFVKTASQLRMFNGNTTLEDTVKIFVSALKVRESVYKLTTADLAHPVN